MHAHKIAHRLIETQQDIQFYYTGTEQCVPGHSWGPGIKDHYKILYVHSGKGIYRIGEEVYHLSKGFAFLLFPDRVAYYQADQDDPWSYSWVAFNGSQAKPYLLAAGFSPEHPVIACSKDQEIRQCLSRLFDAHQQCYSKPLQMTSALYAFLALVLESAGEPPVSQSGRTKDSYVAQAVSFMETNYSRSVTIEEMAHALGLNRKYLTSLFKSATGMPPQQYLCRYRMDKACGLLSETSLSIKEISYSVGYADQLLFSRMFKKAYSMSPSQYRDKLSGSKRG
jgi:AraC-like DNA-binding protein